MKKAFFAVAMTTVLSVPLSASAAYRFQDFKAHPPIHAFGSLEAAPKGLSPDMIKASYHLPKTGGSGVIAIIGAYDDPTIENDLNAFSTQFGLPQCTSKNGCFEKHPMSAGLKKDSGWTMETSLDVEWAHAIAPQAKILLVEAQTPSGANLLSAVDYAKSRTGVVAVSMSFGGAEFSDETSLDSHFSSMKGIGFFASSGDNGAGVSWPAVSPNVVAVGGTSLSFGKDGSFSGEQAWSGSGGGVSAYEKQPAYQASYSVPRSGGMRAIPDVSYDADPASGVSVYYSGGKGSKRWYVFGGTSAGAPQWAAIYALGRSATNASLYADKASDKNGAFFRDIRSGSNGDCGYYCTARARYDYVTGLGSPLTADF
jgi:subtilase family serine protease